MGKEKKSKNRKRSRSRSRDEKRSRKRHNSSSSSSSDDNKLESKLSDERSRRKKERKLEKQRLKDTETAEERMLRRKEKKLKKDQKRKAAVETSIPDELAYTNLNNPFNDTKLTETFVWGKKLEREGKSHLSRKEIEKEARKRIERNLHEAQEFKRVRDARLAAREDMDMMQRDADRREVSNWDSKEQQFQLDQAKERSRIRIAQNRAKAIDILSRYIRYGDEDKTDEEKKNEEEFELEDPLSCLKDLTSDDYEDLIEDIKVYRRLEDDKHMSFWTDFRTIVDDELKKRREEDGRREGIHGSLKTEVMAMFKV
ncbi:unnamed protein product [Caenorhabditis auriculariae]|uniref:Splicing factor cactin central domain-containing protein n=1 Tax=Caenorhabditis auriculariae TaxID=2777116 RepID=A0A8S1HAN3_9PELO|nr:unnamed protein product [Caenorhabditis auriculariae]